MKEKKQQFFFDGNGLIYYKVLEINNNNLISERVSFEDDTITEVTLPLEYFKYKQKVEVEEYIRIKAMMEIKIKGE